MSGNNVVDNSASEDDHLDSSEFSSGDSDLEVAYPSYYPCERKTLRWYKKIFVHILQLTMVNSLQLFNMHTQDKRMSLYDFRLSVIESLLPPKNQPPMVTPPRNALHTLVQNEERDSKGDRKRKGCRVCYSTEKKRKMTTFTCSTCPGKPGLCAVKCFDSFHKAQQ
uniref:PiggyBac transposable element-derived protein 4 C-terminal zinc-finger domain-containing protein n=1 Tax=Graphocephala atropunctata TaxID=36148 RepID=A0A1B6KZ13_9HEMI